MQPIGHIKMIVTIFFPSDFVVFGPFRGNWDAFFAHVQGGKLYNCDQVKLLSGNTPTNTHILCTIAVR